MRGPICTYDTNPYVFGPTLICASNHTSPYAPGHTSTYAFLSMDPCAPLAIETHIRPTSVIALSKYNALKSRGLTAGTQQSARELLTSRVVCTQT